MARKKKMTEAEIYAQRNSITFEEFKERAEKAFEAERIFNPEYSDLRIYEDLPYNDAWKLLRYESAPQEYWMGFQWEKNHYLWISCNPRTNFCWFYTDYFYYVEGRAYGFFSKVCPHGEFGFALADINLVLNNLRIFREKIVDRKMFIMDGKFTQAWKNGDTPLPFETLEANEGSLKLLIDAIVEAKKHPQPEWKGMQLQAYFDSFATLCNYAVKF